MIEQHGSRYFSSFFRLESCKTHALLTLEGVQPLQQLQRARGSKGEVRVGAGCAREVASAAASAEWAALKISTLLLQQTPRRNQNDAAKQRSCCRNRHPVVCYSCASRTFACIWSCLRLDVWRCFKWRGLFCPVSEGHAWNSEQWTTHLLEHPVRRVLPCRWAFGPAC